MSEQPSQGLLGQKPPAGGQGDAAGAKMIILPPCRSANASRQCGLSTTCRMLANLALYQLAVRFYDAPGLHIAKGRSGQQGCEQKVYTRHTTLRTARQCIPNIACCNLDFTSILYAFAQPWLTLHSCTHNSWEIRG